MGYATEWVVKNDGSVKANYYNLKAVTHLIFEMIKSFSFNLNSFFSCFLRHILIGRIIV